MNRISEAARLISSARRNRAPLRALSADVAPPDEAEGYRTQRAVHDLLLPHCGTIVGFKIGCTSAVMQQYLDIPHPCSGGVFASGVHDSGVSLRAADYVRVGVECEIAVRLGRDLASSQAPFTADHVARAIEAYLPAIEIVDDRYIDWQTLGAPTLIADDFFAAAACSGNPSRVPPHPICSMSSVAPRSMAPKQAGAVAPTCSAIRTTLWRGSPIISPPTARACMPGRWC